MLPWHCRMSLPYQQLFGVKYWSSPLRTQALAFRF
jgi:hypothetical protein